MASRGGGPAATDVVTDEPIIIWLRTPHEPPTNPQIRTTPLLLPHFNQKSPPFLTCYSPRIDQNPRKYGNFGRQ